MGCGDATGVSARGALVNAMGCIGEHEEPGLEYMGVEGNVGTTGKTLM